MEKDKLMKVLGLNLGIAFVNIILFSPAIVGLSILGTSILQTALSITAILMSMIIFVIGNYKLLFVKEKKTKSIEVETSLDCVTALKQNAWKKTLKKDISNLLEQIERLEKKKILVKNLLLEKFNSTELSYSKFDGVIFQVEKMFYINMRSAINKINIFDQEEYDGLMDDIRENEFSREIMEDKTSVFNEYIFFIKDSIEDNEQILLKLDRLLLEISKFNSLEAGELENMDAMKEIDELISKTKFYK